MAAHRAPALQASAMVADEESSGHTSSESDGYIQEVLQEVEAEKIQRNHAQTILSDDLSTVAEAGSDASGSNESELEQPLDVLAGMASVPRGDENDALSSHPSSAEENKNEEPACEANWCRSRGGAIARETGTAVTVNAATTSGHGATAIAKDAGLTIWRGRPKRRNHRSPEPRAIRTGRHQLEMRLPKATPASSGRSNDGAA